jgi:hypothetical protein
MLTETAIRAERMHDQRVDEGGEGSLGPAVLGGALRLAHTAQALRADE